MKANDFLNMPKLVLNEVVVKLDKKERESYARFETEMALQVKDQEINAVNAASLSGKLLQMANGACYDANGDMVHIHDRKLDALEDLIEGANGKPVLIAYWFKHDLERIKERFKVREIKSSQDIKDWNAGKIALAVIHPASAGHGLNLQAGGSTMVWFGLTWSLELYEQTNARLWRQGQKSKTVVIEHIVSKGTIDEQIIKSSIKELTDMDEIWLRIGNTIKQINKDGFMNIPSDDIYNLILLIKQFEKLSQKKIDLSTFGLPATSTELLKNKYKSIEPNFFEEKKEIVIQPTVTVKPKVSIKKGLNIGNKVTKEISNDIEQNNDDVSKAVENVVTESSIPKATIKAKYKKIGDTIGETVADSIEDKKDNHALTHKRKRNEI